MTTVYARTLRHDWDTKEVVHRRWETWLKPEPDRRQLVKVLLAYRRALERLETAVKAAGDRFEFLTDESPEQHELRRQLRRMSFDHLNAFERFRDFGYLQRDSGLFWAPTRRQGRKPASRELLESYMVRETHRERLMDTFDIPEPLWPGLVAYAADVELSWRGRAMMDNQDLSEFPPRAEGEPDLTYPA